MRLFVHHLRRTWKMGFLACLALLAFQIIVVRVFTSFSASDKAFLGRTMPKWAQSFLGIDQLQATTLAGFLAIAYQHPFVIVGILSVSIAVASSLLAREYENRTIVFLLARPVSRSGIIISALLVSWLWPAFMVVCAVLGTVVGARVFHVTTLPDRILMGHLALSLYMLSCAVGSISILFSSLTSRHGDAVGWSITVVLIMYVWSFLAQVWQEMASWGVYSLFNYYQPSRILLRGVTTIVDYQVLGTVALTAGIAAIISYAVREFNV